MEVAHKTGIAYTLHICGNTDVILDHMLLTGADALDLDYKTDITKIYNTLHDTTTLIGNIDPSGVLALGTINDVQKKTLELLSIYKNSNRFILNAGCAIPPLFTVILNLVLIQCVLFLAKMGKYSIGANLNN